MRAMKITGIAVAVLVVIAGLVLFAGVPADFLTSAMRTQVERATGYRMTTAGTIRIGIWPSLHVTLNDITLQVPGNRDGSSRLTIGSLQAEVTLSSLWSGHPDITEFVIDRPVLSVPLLRERDGPENTPANGATSSAETESGAISINRVRVTDGTIAFFNLRDRVDDRIEGINADAVIDADRNVKMTGDARAGARQLKFAINAAMPAVPIARQNIPFDLTLQAPGLLKGQLTAKAEARLNGSVVMINGLTGTLGDGAFSGWASADMSSKPLVKLDLDFQRLDIATSLAATPSTAAALWSSASINLGRLNYVDLQAKISAAEINFGQTHVAPAAIDATLANGVLKGRFSNLGAYDGQAHGDLTVDASASTPAFTLSADLVGVRALPLLRSVADFDKLDGKMQAKLAVRSSGASQRAITSNLDGTVSAVFRDGAIRGVSVAGMVRALTLGMLSGWQENGQQATDLSQLSASFRIERGKATTNDINLVGPLVSVTGAGTVDLGEKSLALRVEPKLVMTTEGQGRATDPVGLGIPVVIDGPWDQPRIYPDVAGMLDNPDAAYARLKEMGKGLFGPNGALGGLGGNMPNGNPPNASVPENNNGSTTGDGLDQLGGSLGQTLGDLIRQGLRQGQTPAPPAPDSDGGR
ncbi:MAG: AsmA family protein [Bradyrhizobium sp.]|nr:AsmA family protein [Bradyrhizobium sp.]